MSKFYSTIFIIVALQSLSFSQSWKHIGLSDPAEVFEPNPGDLYPYGIGVIWDLKFEPGYDGKKNTRLFATGISSGLWLSPSGRGNDWILLNTDFLPETSVGDFAINPKDRNKIIIGTGLPKIRQSRNRDLFALPRGKGIFKGKISKNKVKWKLIPNQRFHEGDLIKNDSVFWNEKTKCVGRLCYSGTSDLILVVIEEETKVKYNSSIYKSENGGIDWYLKASYKNLFFHDLDINPTNPKNIVASFSYDPNEPGHIFESNDFGETWNAIFSSSPELNEEGFYKTCYDNEKSARLWICKTTTYSNDIYIRSSENELAPFKKFRQWHNAGSCSAFDISGFGNDYFSAGSVSLNCAFGDKFQNITPEMHSDIRCIAYYPGSRDLVVGNDGGVSLVVFDSLSKSYIVSDLSRGLAIGRITSISSWSKDNYGFANWDNSCRWANPGEKNVKFMDLFGNESTVFEINHNAFLDGSAGPTNAILYTFDTNFSFAQRELYYGDFFTFLPGQSKFLYINGTQMHRVNYSGGYSTDSIIYTHPQGDKYFLQPRVAASNSSIIYTATQQQGAYYHFQVFKSEDGGDTWIEYNIQDYGGFLSDIAINPIDPNKICVGSVNGEVFFSENSGLSFSTNTLPLEAGPVNSLVYINSERVLAACDYGLWISKRNWFGETEWKPFNDLLKKKAVKLPNCRITDVEFLPREGIIRAAAMGRGVFELEIKKLF